MYGNPSPVASHATLNSLQVNGTTVQKTISFIVQRDSYVLSKQTIYIQTGERIVYITA